MVFGLRQWHSLGEDILKSIKEGPLKNIDAVMLIFDLTDELSLENLILWNSEIDQQYPDSKPSKVLVGNKCDLPHNRKLSLTAKVPYSLIQSFADKNNIMYYEASAKTNHLILDSFVYLIKDLLNEKQIIKTERTIPLQ
jgi:GTPase SAR1 family protein